MPRVFDEVASKDEATLKEIGLTRSDIDTVKAGGKINISGRSYVTKDEATLRAIGLSRSDFTESGAEDGGGDSPVTLTNDEKLALQTNTPVGTQVQVTDGFVVSGASESDLNGFWFPAGTNAGKPFYLKPGMPFPDADHGIQWDGSAWTFEVADRSISATGNTDYPWEAEWNVQGATITHPAIQRLSAPDLTLVGVRFGHTQTNFVPTIPYPASSLYTDRGTSNGKRYYNLFGQSDDPAVSAISWNGTSFNIIDSAGVAQFTSSENVSTPNLVSTWTAVNDSVGDTASVTAVLQRDLDAGVTVSGAGTSADNAAFTKRGLSGSQSWPYYNKVGEPSTDPDDTPATRCIFRDEDEWFIQGEVGVANYSTNDATVMAFFPFESLTYQVDAGASPAPTVTRNDVASEANWEVVP